MVQKAKYRQRHKDAFLAGDKKDIPAEALAALEAEEAAKKSVAEKKLSKPDKETKAE